VVGCAGNDSGPLDNGRVHRHVGKAGCPAHVLVSTSVVVPGAPLSLGTGFGSLWVGTGQDNGGALVRINPATNQVIATVPVGGFPVGIAAGYGSIWQAITVHLGRTEVIAVSDFHPIHEQVLDSVRPPPRL
jgi:hypothetical protein